MSYYERTLPHWQPEGRDLFLTWRLSGSLPVEVMAGLRARKTEPMGKRFREYDLELDRSSFGPLWLKEPRVALWLFPKSRGSQLTACVMYTPGW